MRRIYILAAVLFSMVAGAEAKVVLPAILGSNMVLQQQADVKVWGEAKPRSTVEVRASWSDAAFTAQADNNGRWELFVKTPDTDGKPCTVTISDGDGEPVVLENVLLGEVWLCSGQSNMEMPLEGFWNCPVEGANETIALAADYKNIRVATVGKVAAVEPCEDTSVEWKTCNPDNAQWFSAVGFHFASMMNRVLKVPVGIIVCAWGGSRVEGWLPAETVAQYPDIDLEKEMRPKDDGSWSWMTPVVMYNGMLHPLRHFTVKGFLWYQGESNVGHAEDYRVRLQSMVEQWRREWNDPTLPFYLVELAPYRYGGDGTSGARFREMQHRIAAELPYSGIVCTNDLVYPYEDLQIHPCRKREVGHRLAYLALNRTYGCSGIECAGAVYKCVKFSDGKAEIWFDNAESGFSPWLNIEGFEIAGADRCFYPATATVDTDHKTVIVSSEKVSEPVAVRYCFRDFQIGNLSGHRGFPVTPFRTDNWE